MRYSRFYYNDTYLGILYENGLFDYMINSNYAQSMDIENAVHILERIRRIGLQDDFDFDKYIQTYNNSQFKDGFEFR